MIKRILLPYAGTSVGGSYISSAEVAGYIQRNLQLQCQVLLPERNSNDAIFRREGLIPHHYHFGAIRVSRVQQTIGFRLKLQALPSHLMMLKIAVSQLRRLRPHLVHINDGRTFFPWALAARSMNIPVLWHVRGVAGNSYLDRFRLNLSNQLIFVSDAIRNRFGDTIKQPHKTIYNAVNLERFHPPDDRGIAKEKLGLKSDRTTIGFVANLLPFKRPEWAIRTVLELVSKGNNVDFVWCGSDPSGGAYENRLRKMVVEAGMGQHFHFLGYRSKIEEVMQALDLLLVTSTAKGEGFPRVVIEAMACGAAVISTRCGGVAETIEDGRTGILVEADDYPAIIRAATQLITQPNYCRKLSEKAVANIRSRFSLSQIGQQVGMVYKHLLEQYDNNE
jgi:glycosyltransferase involved in cell wall biosynthesis